MISCQNIVDFCVDYLEGSLPSDDQTGFDRHLTVCGACLSFFESYRRTSEISREALATEMPLQVKEAVRSYLRARCTSDRT
jgi:predicted anti-sigma-YlaC factor YlaD